MLTDTQKTLLYFGGALTGAIAGYLIAELITDRIIFGTEKKEGEKTVVLLNEIEPKAIKSNEPKPALSDLVRKYQPNPIEMDEAPIRIISQEEAHKTSGDPTIREQYVRYYVEDDVYIIEEADIPELMDSKVLENPEDVLVPDIDMLFELEGSDYAYCLNVPLNTLFTIERIDEAWQGETGQPQVVSKPSPVAKKRRKIAAKPQLDVAEELSEDDGPKNRRKQVS